MLQTDNTGMRSQCLSHTGSAPAHGASLLRDWFPCAGAVLSLAQTHRGRPQTTSTRLYAGGELQGSPVWDCSPPGSSIHEILQARILG